MYKKSAPTSSSTGSFSTRRDPLDRMPERERERDRDRDREREQIPGRYGGQRGSMSKGGDYGRRDSDRSADYSGQKKDDKGVEERGDYQDSWDGREDIREYIFDLLQCFENLAS